MVPGGGAVSYERGTPVKGPMVALGGGLFLMSEVPLQAVGVAVVLVRNTLPANQPSAPSL